MHARGALLRGRAETDRRLGDDHHRHIRDLERTAIDTVDLVVVVSVAFQNLPAVAFETLLRIVRHRERRGPLDRDAVRVIDEREPAELEVAREGARLMRDALLEVSVAAEDPCVVRVAVPARRQRHAHAHRDALTERTRRYLHARHHTALGMSRAPGTELAEGLHLIHLAALHARQMEKRIDEHRSMAAGEHQPVAHRPVHVLGIEIQVFQPQGDRKVRHAHRRTGMAALGLFDGIRREAAHRVRRPFQLFIRVFHRYSPLCLKICSA